MTNALSALLLMAGLSGVAFAQAPTATAAQPTPATQSAVTTSAAAEAKARDEEFARWKARYATNRAIIARQVKDIKAILIPFRAENPARGQELTDLLNGSIKRWNVEKTDYGDPDQFAACEEVLATIRKAIETGSPKK